MTVSKYPEYFEPEILSNDPSFSGDYASPSAPGEKEVSTQDVQNFLGTEYEFRFSKQ